MPQPISLITALYLSVLSAAAVAQTGGDMVPAASDEPVYKVFFESGYYTQALDYLETRLPSLADSQWVDHQKYRAFCLIVLDRRDSALAAFSAILEREPEFGLDPIYTSPKIFEVFHEARRLYLEAHPDTVRADTVAAALDTTVVLSTGLRDSDTLELPSYRVPLYILPGGVGQFYNGQRAKGWVLLGTQVACLAASVISYVERESRYDPDYE
jgi:hypothetical protein